jgi:hypothetical protein
MKKQLGLVAIAFSLLGAAAPFGPGDIQTTDRKVHGVITAIDGTAMTIADAQRSVTGKIDASRTKVTINGHPGKISDLKLTEHAKAELCLDDTWLVVDEH